MKTTTYIIAGLAVAGALTTALVSGALAGYDNGIERYNFDRPDFKMQLPECRVVEFDWDRNSLERTFVSVEDLRFNIIESDTITSPEIVASESWRDLLSINAKGDTLSIMADFHGLADFYEMPEEGYEMNVYLYPTNLTLMLPQGMMESLKVKPSCTTVLSGIHADRLDIFTGNDLVMDSVRIGALRIEQTSKSKSNRWDQDIAFASSSIEDLWLNVAFKDFNLTGAVEIGRLSASVDLRPFKGPITLSDATPSISLGTGVNCTRFDWLSPDRGNINLDMSVSYSMNMTRN